MIIVHHINFDTMKRNILKKIIKQVFKCHLAQCDYTFNVRIEEEKYKDIC